MLKGDTLYFGNSFNSIYLLETSDPYRPFIVDSIPNLRSMSFDFYGNNIISLNEYVLSVIGDTTTVSIQDNLILKEGYYLNQNVPNPSSEKTTIYFRLNERMHVKLELFDKVGRKLKVLIDESMNSDKHSINLNTSFLEPGIYYYKLMVKGKIFRV